MTSRLQIFRELRNVPGFQSAEALANAGRFLSVRSATFEVTVTGGNARVADEPWWP